MGKLLQWLFGCRHPHQSWPFSRVNGRRRPTYRTCLDCGAEIRYTKLEDGNSFKYPEPVVRPTVEVRFR